MKKIIDKYNSLVEDKYIKAPSVGEKLYENWLQDPIHKNEEDSKCITCSVFRPGSIIITGGNDLNIYKQTLENLLFILKNNNNVLY